MVAVVVAFAVTAVVLFACCAAAALHVLQVRNRVVPDVKTHAPLTWLWSARSSARLHRRLRRSVLGTRLTLGESTFAELAAAVEQRAVLLDRELAARVRPSRDLRAEVEGVEALNQRLVAMARTRRTDLIVVRERLDALDAALRELEAPPAFPNSA